MIHLVGRFVLQDAYDSLSVFDACAGKSLSRGSEARCGISRNPPEIRVLPTKSITPAEVLADLAEKTAGRCGSGTARRPAGRGGRCPASCTAACTACYAAGHSARYERHALLPSKLSVQGAFPRNGQETATETATKTPELRSERRLEKFSFLSRRCTHVCEVRRPFD